ncbi:MAG: NAD(P)-dependent oxidoreductase [Candidatus Magasanikbacteria bacterium]|nr:NAD(P)-dependent oxidoreductase [Candidatus Magasanikbacteria bacterium]
MAAANALIGYTGFVGGNILDQKSFDFLYNSKNIETIAGKKFDVVVCAGVPAVKWLANKEPENDRAIIKKLTDNLEKIEAKKFILISTVDVYPATKKINEDCVIDTQILQPYGKHRRQLEEFISQRFDSLIVRLPGLFGRGLKKNPLFDLMQGNFTYIHPENTLQFYNLAYIWKDINKSLENNLKVVNFVTEPVALKVRAEKTLKTHLPDNPAPPTQSYDISTKHAALWGNTNSYLYSKKQVLEDIKTFISSYNKSQTG